MSHYEDPEFSVDDSRLATHLGWFSQVRRDTGGPGEEAAAAYIVDVEVFV